MVQGLIFDSGLVVGGPIDVEVRLLVNPTLFHIPAPPPPCPGLQLLMKDMNRVPHLSLCLGYTDGMTFVC